MKKLLKLSGVVGTLVFASQAVGESQFGPVPVAPGLAVSQPAAPEIEVVFVLDTTGSMGGLITAAKQKIWSIATSMAQAKPTPKIKMGLVGYRDRNDQYETKLVPITEDLDAMYTSLMSFNADGGGDEPESVNKALNEAVDKFQWKSGPGVYRTIFLVGDAPPHLDYQDDVKYQESVRKAVSKGIIINTIQCGSIPSTTPIWKEIALNGEGKFFQVDQSGSAAPSSSPYDSDLQRLSRELDTTRMYWGSAETKAVGASKIAVGRTIDTNAPLAAQAGRAVLNASEGGKDNFAGKGDLLIDLERGDADLRKMKEEELPEQLKGVSGAKRTEVIAENKARRERIRKEIQVLDAKRQSYLSQEAKKAGRDHDSFDAGVFRSIQEQAKSKARIEIQGDVRY